MPQGYSKFQSRLLFTITYISFEMTMSLEFSEKSREWGKGNQGAPVLPWTMASRGRVCIKEMQTQKP